MKPPYVLFGNLKFTAIQHRVVDIAAKMDEECWPKEGRYLLVPRKELEEAMCITWSTAYGIADGRAGISEMEICGIRIIPVEVP